MPRINLLIFLLLVAVSVHSQDILERKKKFSLPKITVTQSGPYIGLQKGKFNAIEFGLEGQYKRVRLVKNVTHALHTGFNYNFYENVLGYDAGYWFKQSRLGLTYGLNFVYRTNFIHKQIGLSPVLGYKLWQFHFQVGCNLMTRPVEPIATNILYVSLRFVLINQRDVKMKRTH